jgi:hypothetical protein
MKAELLEKMKRWNFGGIAEYLCWIPITELAQMKAFPLFFKDKLLKLPEALGHIISDERIGQC